jgi:adenylate cyclase
MTTRRLAAILAADMVGFSSMMERDEEGTLARLKALRQHLRG